MRASCGHSTIQFKMALRKIGTVEGGQKVRGQAPHPQRHTGDENVMGQQLLRHTIQPSAMASLRVINTPHLEDRLPQQHVCLTAPLLSIVATAGREQREQHESRCMHTRGSPMWRALHPRWFRSLPLSAT